MKKPSYQFEASNASFSVANGEMRVPSTTRVVATSQTTSIVDGMRNFRLLMALQKAREDDNFSGSITQ
jgi:hypothetical protein